MPIGGPIPEQVLALAAAGTVFTVMLYLGLGIVLGEFRWVLRHPGMIAKGLFSALVAVPVIALAVTRVFDLSRAAEIGIVLMAIAPGAPVALSRSLGAGGHRSFAPALQILVAVLAVVSMPLSIAVLNLMYQGNASIAPSDLALQVFIAQLLPLSIGMLLRRLVPGHAERLATLLGKVSRILLVVLTILLVIDVWQLLAEAAIPAIIAMALVSVLALAVGHWLGGPEPATRTAVAICSAARNPGLALLVATVNHAPPAMMAAVLAYLVVSAPVVTAYVVWRRTRSPRGATAPP